MIHIRTNQNHGVHAREPPPRPIDRRSMNAITVAVIHLPFFFFCALLDKKNLVFPKADKLLDGGLILVAGRQAVKQRLRWCLWCMCVWRQFGASKCPPFTAERKDFSNRGGCGAVQFHPESIQVILVNASVL